MEENREPLSAIAIEKKLQLLRNKHFSEDTIALVKSDYEYGLTEEEISLYLNKSYDIEQMKILSECLHKDVPKEVIDIIKNTKYSVHQMQVSLEFYEKGVPVQTIKEVMDKGEKPITMRRLYEEVLEQLNKVKKQIPEESEYVKALISQMDEVVAKINHQNERYDALNKKLSEIETSKDDEEVRERLVKENQDKDALINSQQNELNKASSTIARLRDDIEKKDKEMKRMGDRIESLEDKIISVATENKKEAESKAEPQESQSVSQADKKMVDTVAVPQNMQAVANGIPVYYQIPVVDGTGNVVQRLPIERSVRKSSNSGVASLFARLSFKKKSRADIVKLVASGDLVPAQLVQIKSAIEKGLTESQLIYKLFLEGKGYTPIAKYLNEQGIMSPLMYLKSLGYQLNVKTNGVWTKTTVKSILTNQAYIGSAVHGKVVIEKYNNIPLHATDPSEWVIVENTHEPLVDKETFEKAQERVKEISDAYFAKEFTKHPPNEMNLLKGKIVCGDCGKGMRLSPRTTKSYVYFCGTFSDGINPACSRHKIDQEEVNKAVFAQISNHMRCCIDALKVIRELNARSSGLKKYDVYEKAITRQRRELEKVNRKFSELYGDYSEHLINESEYLTLKQQYLLKSEALKKEIDNLLVSQNLYSKNYKIDEDWENLINKYLKCRKLNKELADAFVDKVQVFEDGRISVNLVYDDCLEELLQVKNKREGDLYE